MAGICVPLPTGGIVDQAHIPQERGGALGKVVACSWEGVELERVKTVGGRTDINRDAVDVRLKLCSYCQRLQLT